MTEPETKPGDHFWAEMDGALVAMIHDKRGLFYVCGGWECDIHRDNFRVIEIIKRPEGCTLELYY